MIKDSIGIDREFLAKTVAEIQDKSKLLKRLEKVRWG